MSITEILSESRERESRIFGVVVGIVTNNQDPEKIGRVKVKIPRISGKDESNWARVVSFMAGKNRGAVFLPEVDDEVLVAFEYGDINMPYIIGALWNGKDVPPEKNENGENNIRMIKSRSGHIIKLDDKRGEEKIEIVDKTGKNLITIDAKEKKIMIASDKDIEISAKKGRFIVDAKEIKIKSAGRTEIVSKGATKIESKKEMDLKASKNLNAKGKTINLN